MNLDISEDQTARLAALDRGGAAASGSERILAIDLIRGTAVFFMIAVHTLWMFGSHQAQVESGFGHWLHILGQGTSAFLIVMGFSFMVTRDRSLRRAIHRGVITLAIGYLMNALKFLVPIYVFRTMPETFVQAYGWHYPLTLGQALYLFGTGDILQMAGVSFILIGLVRRYVTQPYAMLALALGAILLSVALRGLHVGVPLIDYGLDLLWGDQWNVYFPVFPWIAHVLVGMFLGMMYVRQGRTQAAFLRTMAKLGMILLSLGLIVSLTDWHYHFNDFFHTGPGGTVYLIGLGLCGYSLIIWLLGDTLRNTPWLMAAVTYLSTHVTTLYVTQWTLICWTMGLVGFHTLTMAQVLVMMPVMVLATLLGEWLMRRLRGWLFGKPEAVIQPVAS